MRLLGMRFLLLCVVFIGIHKTICAQGILVSGRQAYCPLDVIHIGSNFTFAGSSSGIPAFYIQISQGYQVSVDRLTLTGNHPTIVPQWSTSEGRLTLIPANGTLIPLDEVEAAVRDVVYQSFSIQLTSEKFFSFSMGAASYLPSNGHYYEYIREQGITWGAAESAASSRDYFGLQGYLATVTTLEEAQLVGEQVRGAGWIGASDEAEEGVWRWVSGPESGTIFWNGDSTGSSPNFSFWNVGEPNNFGEEHYAHITDPSIGVPGSWNDLPFEGGEGPYEPTGYVVEYGGMPNDPTLRISGSTSIFVYTIRTTLDDEVCDSGSMTLSAFSNDGEVIWFDQSSGGDVIATGQTFTTPILTETTTYYASVMVDGCMNNPRVAIDATVNQHPSITFIRDDRVCVGNAASISAASDFGTIRWFESPSSTTPVSTGNIFNTPELFEDTTYYVEADDDGCNSGERTPVTIIVSDVIPTFDLPEEATICLDQGSIFVEATNPGGTYSYRWRNEEGNLIGSAQGIPITNGGIYTVIALSDNGCPSDPKTLTVYESELSTFTAENLTIDDRTDNNRVVIDTRSIGVGTYEFVLDDPNGFYTTNPVFERLEPGLHTLYIRDVGGCGNLSYQFAVLDYPSFFTPNDDGINDVWQLKGINGSFYTTAEINIYNRYGILVAVIDPESAGWNGISKGWRLPSNDYWFSVKLTDINGVTIERKGHFSLLRR